MVGPTATGKSDLGMEVARRLGGEIVSVDSRQAYRGMEVGTGAPTEEMRREVPHHGVCFLEPGERYGAGRFARLARRWIEDIRNRGRVPVLVGGTGLFLHALLDPVFEEPEVEPRRRERLRRWLESRAPRALRRWARRLDPELEDRRDHLDPQRCNRTLELALLTGRPLTWFWDHGEPVVEPLDALVYCLRLDPTEHRGRIGRRARRMLAAGWTKEVERLREEGHGEGSAAFDALGYRDVARVVDGELDAEEAAERIARDTWQYARRQRTWFRHQLPEHAVRLDAARGRDQLAARIAGEWRDAAGTGVGATAGQSEEGR